MKILYAIQGTGNGHLSRARDVIPSLKRKGVDLDILISGTQADLQLPYPVRYRLKGLSFIFGVQGGVDLWRTYLKANSRRLNEEVKSLPVAGYDMVINDFEPVSAWACKLRGQACIGLSHQAAVLAPCSPKPRKNDPVGRLILRNYAPSTKQFGFHFKAYQENIFTPVVRQDIRQARLSQGDYYTVYLPSYDDMRLLKVLSRVKGVRWEVFSKHNRNVLETENLVIRPVTSDAFVKSMAGSRGVLCGAGFETPAEALFMKKKLLVIPMKGQYEQQCNMAALREMGVPVLKSLKKKNLDALQEFIDTERIIEVSYPDITDCVIDRVLETSPGIRAQPAYEIPFF